VALGFALFGLEGPGGGVLWASIDVREGEAGDSGGENGTRDRDIG
jgi:hypothetical protein